MGGPLRERQRKRNSQPKELDWYQRVIDQKRTEQDSIDAIHKPYTTCMVKGKAHKT
ncbi:MAG: hypothetical protein OXE77_09845 [Flavobacteriaceae bacterium]|nr:hypothetical protein [Flavobacteriaceae bacterium]